MILEAKHRVKRRIAKTCFATELVVIAILALTWFFGDADTAKNIEASTGLLGSILFGFNLIILGYMGISHHSDINQ